MRASIKKFKLKFPPYAKNLIKKLEVKDFPKNDIYLFLGKHAWSAAKAFSLSQTVLLLPTDKSPYLFQWPVFNLPVLIINTGNASEHLIKQTAHALLSAHAAIVRVIDKETGSMMIFKR